MIDFAPMNDQDEGADDVPIFSEFYDSRLVTIYDRVNPIAGYETFYLDLAGRLSSSSIMTSDVALGCLPASWPNAAIG